MPINSFPDKWLNLLGIVPEQVCHFSSLSIFCLGCKTISRRAARRLIVLHPKQNIESELKWQTCSGTMPSKFSHLSGKELIGIDKNHIDAVTCPYCKIARLIHSKKDAITRRRNSCSCW